MRMTVAKVSILVVSVLAVAAGATGSATAQDNDADPAPTIVGGQAADPDDFPFMAALYTPGPAPFFRCGGAVIDERWILTAAHCVASLPMPEVVVGAIDRNGSGQLFTVKRFVIHPEYDYVDGGSSITHDIALLELESPTTAPTIRLATPANGALWTGGQAVTAIGFGYVDAADVLADRLQVAELPVLPDDTCEAAIGFFVRDVMLCTQAEAAAAACPGDSGSPIFGTTSDGERVHVGVASWKLDGEACELGTYSGFAETSAYGAFIAETIGYSPSAPADTEPAAGPEVALSVSCLAGNGRIDINLVNVNDSPTVYRIELEGLSPRELTIAPLDWGRQSFTGRQDGSYAATIRRDGVEAVQTHLDVACDSEPMTSGDEVQVVNACRNGDGYLLVQVVNESNEPKPYVFSFDGVGNRSTSAGNHGASIRAITGRPDGDYTLQVSSGNDVVNERSITVDCDAAPAPVIDCAIWNEPAQAQRIAVRSSAIVDAEPSGWALRRGPSTAQTCDTGESSFTGDLVDLYAVASGGSDDATSADDWFYIHNRTRDVWGWILSDAIAASTPTTVDCSVWNEPTSDQLLTRFRATVVGASETGWNLRHGPSVDKTCDTGINSFEGDSVDVFAVAPSITGDANTWFYIYNHTRDVWGWVSARAVTPAN